MDKFTNISKKNTEEEKEINNNTDKDYIESTLMRKKKKIR
jgi:hypothetical protein